MPTSTLRIAAIPYHAILACLAVIASGAILVETSSYGIGVSPDSVNYIRLARKLAQPDGLLPLFGSQDFVRQPPLFPVLLASIAKATGADPFVSVRYLNALLLAVCLYVTGASFFGKADDPPHPAVALAVPLFVLFSRSLHLVFTMAWTEPLFIVIVLLFLVSMSRYLAEGSRRFLLTATSLAIAAVYTRYSGVTLIATGVLLIPFASRFPMRKRRVDLLFFSGATSAAFGTWVLRNLLVSGSPLGQRSPAVYSLAENAVLSLSVLQGHFLPEGREFPPLLGISIAFAFGLLAVWTYAPLATRLRQRIAEDRAALAPCALFSLVFCAFTIVTSTLVAYDPIDFRLFAPIYLPVLVFVASVASDAMRVERSGRSRRIRIVTVLLLTLALVHPVRQFAVDFCERFRNGSGLNHRVFIESELMGFLKRWRELEHEKPIFTNAPMALAWHLGIDARRSPDRKRCASEVGERARECFLETTDPGFFNGYLVYFDAQKYPYFYSFEELAELVDLRSVEVTADGGIYEVSRRGADD